MAAKTKAQREAEAALAAAELSKQQQGEPEEITPNDMAVMNLLSELQGDASARVRIYRQGKTHRDLTLLDEVTVTEFDPMMLAHPPYNGGVFRLHIRNDHGFVAAEGANTTLKIEPKAVPLAQTFTPPPAQDMGAIVREMMAAMQANTMAILEKATAAQTPQRSRKEELEELQLMASILRPASAVPVENGFEKQLSTFARFQEIIKGMAPTPIAGADGEVSELAVMATMFKEVMGAARAAKESQAPQLPAPADATVENAVVSDEDAEMGLMQQLYIMQLRKACRKAAAGLSAVEYAADVYDDLPDADLQTMANDAHWFEKMCALVPECATLKDWFTAARDEIIRMAVEDGLIEKESAADTPVPDTSPPAQT